MSHFAKIENGVVVQVIVAEEDFILTGALGDPANFVQTSYNTHGNQHPQGRPLRGNYAGIGYAYDDVNDVFIAPKPFDNWVLDTATWLWTPPIPMPVDEYFYTWNQETTAWEKGNLRPIPEPVVEAPVEAVVESAPVAETVVEPEAVVETPIEPAVETPVEPVAETPANPVA
jgi:hypothetical protein